MPRICYVPRHFRPSTQAIIEVANGIIDEVRGQGFTLTLRQLYYQLIARDVLPDSWIDKEYNKRRGLPENTKNTDKNYDRLGSIINDARLAGEIDWSAIEDRARILHYMSHWSGPADRIKAARESFQIDKWEKQQHRLEVWIEKDALAGVIERPCNDYDVPFFVCRGYSSVSGVWSAAMRIHDAAQSGYKPVILHLGDHDPSGMDMSRDVRERLELLSNKADFVFDRVALNMGQIKSHRLPPNPAKTTDCRCKKYVAEYGNQSWELDALSPAVLADMLRGAIANYVNQDQWRKDSKREDSMRSDLEKCEVNWPTVKRILRRMPKASKAAKPV